MHEVARKVWKQYAEAPASMPSLSATTNMQLFRVSSELQVTATMFQHSGVARRVVWEVEAPPTLFLHFAHVCAHTPTHTQRTELLCNTRTKKNCVSMQNVSWDLPQAFTRKEIGPIRYKNSQKFYSPDKHTCTANCICTKGRRSAHRSH